MSIKKDRISTSHTPWILSDTVGLKEPPSLSPDHVNEILNYSFRKAKPQWSGDIDQLVGSITKPKEPNIDEKFNPSKAKNQLKLQQNNTHTPQSTNTKKYGDSSTPWFDHNNNNKNKNTKNVRNILSPKIGENVDNDDITKIKTNSKGNSRQFRRPTYPTLMKYSNTLKEKPTDLIVLYGAKGTNLTENGCADWFKQKNVEKFTDTAPLYSSFTKQNKIIKLKPERSKNIFNDTFHTFQNNISEKS